jgi:hypothetical protein
MLILILNKLSSFPLSENSPYIYKLTPYDVAHNEKGVGFFLI